MEMMMNVGMSKLAIADDSMEKRRGNLVKVVPPRKCRVCSKDGVRHLDTDCWEDDCNADK